MRSSFLEGFARKLPVLLIFICIASLFTGGAILGRWDYSVRGLIVAVPTTIASVVLIYMFKHPIADDDEATIAFFRLKVAPYFLFVLIYLISMIVLVADVNRFIYFLLITALYFTIFIQIYSQKIYSNAIILEIISILVNVIYGTTLVYPLFFRTTDLMGHIILSTVTFLSGHTIPVDLDVSYAFFPLFHIYNAMSSNILGLSPQDAHFIVTCPAYVVVIFFLYMMLKIISNNEQVSLLACLCFSITPIVLLEGIMMVTRTAAFVGFVILLYLIFASNEKALLSEIKTKSVIFKSLIILFIIYIMFIHQVSTPQIIVLMVIYIVCELILAKAPYFSTHLILFMIISFGTYWFFSAWLFTGPFIASRIGLDYFDLGQRYQLLSDPSLSQMQVAVMFLINQIDMGIFLFFALIGIGYILFRQKPQYLSVVAMFSLLVMILYVPNPLFTSQTISNAFRIDRFSILLTPFMALAMASGVFLLSKISKKYTKSKAFYLLISVLFLLFILVSLRYPIMDITSKEGRLYFTDGELSGYNFVTEKIPYGSKLYSDYHASRFFSLHYFSIIDQIGLPYYWNDILSDLKWSPQSNQYVIFRNSKFEDGSLLFEREGNFVIFVSNEENKKAVKYFHDNNDVLFNSKQISIMIGNDRNNK